MPYAGKEKEMDEKVKKHLIKYCNSKGYPIDDETLFEVIMEGKNLHREEVSQHRWWNNYLYVVEIDGMIIGYVYGEANRDVSMSDLGYEFDSSSICEMEPVEKVVISYVPVSEPEGGSGENNSPPASEHSCSETKEG